jgi:flagellar biosynthesis GTPase FlhF
MSEALSAVRRSLGPDALILQSRSVSAGNGLGVEVTAMNEELDETRGEPRFVQHESSAAEPLKEVQEGIAEVRALLKWLLPGMARKGLAEKLLDQGLSPEIIARLAREMEGMEEKDDRGRIFAALSRLIPCAGELVPGKAKQQRLVLIGPTGVGKTTAIIKLTVRLAGQTTRRVGWIGLESGRSVGADLLASYCGILGKFAAGLRAALGVRQRLRRCSRIQPARRKRRRRAGGVARSGAKSQAHAASQRRDQRPRHGRLGGSL